MSHRSLEQKGILTLRERISYEGAIYHVTQRAPGREIIFVEEADYEAFRFFINRVAERHALELYAYALLTNHVHLLIQTKEANLSEAMKNIFETYAVYFNRKYSRKGHVFCGRFRACLCNDDVYLLAASVYIHLNPVRSGLCEKPGGYPWSSALVYLDGLLSRTINVSRILSLLSKDMGEARAKYSKIMEASLRMKPKTKQSKIWKKDMLSEEAFLAKEVMVGRPLDDILEEGYQRGMEDRLLTKYGHKSKEYRAYLVDQMVANGHALDEIQRTLGISRATYYRVVNKGKGRGLN